jgi:molybdate transport system regulatory protein
MLGSTICSFSDIADQPYRQSAAAMLVWAMATALTLRIRVKHGGALLMGPGRADLLAQIAATGSIAAAGRAMGMSYKRAWALVEAMNRVFHEPLVEAAKGGAGGGGARLTPNGQAILDAYRRLEEAAGQAGATALAQLAAAAIPG